MEFDFLQTLTFLLIALLFGKDNLLPWLGQKFFGAKPNGTPDWAKNLVESQEHLKLHYNDTTTTVLNEISSKLTKMCDKIENILVEERDEREERKELARLLTEIYRNQNGKH